MMSAVTALLPVAAGVAGVVGHQLREQDPDDVDEEEEIHLRDENQ